MIYTDWRGRCKFKKHTTWPRGTRNCSKTSKRLHIVIPYIIYYL